MPNYKKKKVNKFLNSPTKVKKSRIQKNNTEDIKMKPSVSKRSKTEEKPDVKVIKGKKAIHKLASSMKISIAILVVVVLTVLHFFLPAGLFGSIMNTVSLIGSGNFPIELDSTEIIDTVNKGSYFYVLTDSSINAFSNAGKKLFSHPHTFENPIIKTSKTQALVYNQGGNEALIFDISDLKYSVDTKNAIISADISNSGRFALVTKSEKYTASVLVYDKNGKDIVYEWYSAEKMINNVAISPSGRKIAISLLASNVSNFDSEVYVLNYKSANPEHTESFKNSIIYDINSTHTSAFSIITSNSVKFVKWSNYKSSVYNNDYNTAFFRAGKGGYLLVFNRESDKTDNKIAVFSKSGKLKYETVFKGIISDIRIWNRHIYCINDNSVLLLSEDGNVVRSATCDFGTKNLMVLGGTDVAVINNGKIEKIKLEQE